MKSTKVEYKCDLCGITHDEEVAKERMLEFYHSTRTGDFILAPMNETSHIHICHKCVAAIQSSDIHIPL